MSDEDRAAIEEGMRAKPELFVPMADEKALNLFVIHALRDMSQQTRQLNGKLEGIENNLGSMKEQLIRWEGHVGDIANLKSEIAALKEEKQRRAGMQWLVEWVAKYIPWLAAAAAAVWALKSNPGG